MSWARCICHVSHSALKSAKQHYSEQCSIYFSPTVYLLQVTDVSSKFDWHRS